MKLHIIYSRLVYVCASNRLAAWRDVDITVTGAGPLHDVTPPPQRFLVGWMQQLHRSFARFEAPSINQPQVRFQRNFIILEEKQMLIIFLLFDIKSIHEVLCLCDVVQLQRVFTSSTLHI